MDSFRGFEDEAALAHAADDEPAMERPPEIGVDERRMHVRAYNYWVSLLNGRPYPSIGDVDPHTLEDFGRNSVLLDFSRRPAGSRDRLPRPRAARRMRARPRIRYISEVPAPLPAVAPHRPLSCRSSPIGRRSASRPSSSASAAINTLYRGILMPLSSNGESIDFIYGVINWKELADSSTAYALEGEVDRAIAAAPPVGRPPGLGRRTHAELPDSPADLARETADGLRPACGRTRRTSG